MKRVSTIKNDLYCAAADLELAAEKIAAKGDHAEVSRLRSEAGAIYQVAGRI